MKIIIFISLTVIYSFCVNAQGAAEQLKKTTAYYEQLLSEKDSLEKVLEDLKLQNVITRIKEKGLPELEDSEVLICHSAMCLVFSKEHRLAKWVVHKLTGDIITGNVSRTNDYRADPKISHTGEDADYFVRYINRNGEVVFNGFGYDRGHLAPSADFRWSERALSESYYYSNITPQTAEFNREKWAEIESFLRTYILNNPDNPLFIITAPVLEDDLPVIERGVNHLPIPHLHYKIAVDYKRKKGIAFLVPQRDLTLPIESYAVTIDSIENLTGINFFASLPEEDQELIESSFDFSLWQDVSKPDAIRPFAAEKLPPNTYNTTQAQHLVSMRKNVTVCGTVVSTHKSDAGHIFINLDQRFPNQVFSVNIWQRNTINFSYAPEVFLKNKRICVTGRVTSYNDVPTMSLENEKNLEVME